MTLSICIVTWNSMKFIKDCLEAIFNQTIWHDKNYQFAINIVDNGSTDGTVDFVRTNYPEVRILKNINNLGFCRAYNQAIKMHQSDWVLILNPDVILTDEFLAEILSAVFKAPDNTAALSGKILRAETLLEEGGLAKIAKTDIIDSFGLLVKKSRLVKNIGEGEKDINQYAARKEVFGFSGGCVLYRRAALESVKFQDEYFDEDFFAYQDDFDLSYRLQLLNWQSFFVPAAKAYHFRSARNQNLRPWQFWTIRKARRAKSQLINFHSYKNHLFVLIKNEAGANFWRHLPFIFWLEFKKFIFLLFFEPKTLKAYGQFFKLLPRMILKRKIIFGRKHLPAAEIRKWFVA